jgi:hypothetical protein
MRDSGQGEVWRSIGSVVPSFLDWVTGSKRANFYSKGCVSMKLSQEITHIRAEFLGAPQIMRKISASKRNWTL